MRVLIVPDKFKGTLTAHEAGKAIAEGWASARPNDFIAVLPMSDGGDGFGQVVGDLLGAEVREFQTIDAAHRPVTARWWWVGKTKTAVIEAAQANGLAQLPKGQFHPFELDTEGVGRLLSHIAGFQPHECYIGIGGSATNDGGFGTAHALGWQFVDATGCEIVRWTQLQSAVKVIGPVSRLKLGRVCIAVDVDNPLLGPNGCSAIYGPQKGLKANEIAPADAALKKLAELMISDQKESIEVAKMPGAGAAGGLGFALAALLGGSLISGFSIFERLSKLADRIGDADLVISAEGSLDPSTLMGKGVGGVAKLCLRMKKSCFGMAGVAEKDVDWRSHFVGVQSIVGNGVQPEEAMTKPKEHLAWLAKTVALGFGRGE